VGPGGTPNGVCQQIETPNTHSVSIEDIDLPCTVTVYSDDYCSFNATEVVQGTCVSPGFVMHSFSVDSCAQPKKVSSSSSAAAKSTSASVASSSAVSGSATASVSGTSATTTPPSSANSQPQSVTSSSTSTASVSGTAVAAASSKKSVNKGAIAGGVIGGVAIIAIVGVIAFIMFQRHRIRTWAQAHPGGIETAPVGGIGEGNPAFINPPASPPEKGFIDPGKTPEPDADGDEDLPVVPKPPGPDGGV